MLKNDKVWREEFQDIVIDPIRESYEKLAGLPDTPALARDSGHND